MPAVTASQRQSRPTGEPTAGAPFAYTVRDTPAITARIDADMAKVVSTLRAGDPHLRAVVLTGGFARGEGMVMDGKPQNDYDFVAIRGSGRPSTPYAVMQRRLEDELGLHIDLGRVATWRLRWVTPSIFWYETALRGRVIWGEGGDALLAKLPVRAPFEIAPTEALRLLVNRAAGLLLVTNSGDLHQHRLQAAKALLASADVHLLCSRRFAPSQVERHAMMASWVQHETPGPVAQWDQWYEWYEWAFQFKVDPEHAPHREAKEAWQAARKAMLAAIPRALQHARMASLDDYARKDGMLDMLVYATSGSKPRHAPTLALHPTGRVRVATLRLLEASPDGRIPTEAADTLLAGFAASGSDPVRTLDALRHATLQ